ncbi:LysR family transcriptional regulator [Methylocapsa palsarum]|uniref:DNA-binding transcriptional regulator, LysR family n=1 Tax=Methylocapsa palsarum TaxID=1612308 RepID=A0A1I3YWP6_9HYPH|nr:LysR substrate-binding domain-containing protein [Methylocapsa palsarum]SFK35626.1 DNA-binding transcriptional regulator, LysR family [Methylocapsa palsarum]
MLDPILLRTFLLIAEGNSFSAASRKLGLGQPTVSDHIRKLEQEVGHRLFVRDTHSVSLTCEGEAMIEFARRIIETNERARRHFAGTKLRGRLRFGASEDLVSSWLPEVLRGFLREHPLVDLEFTIALSNSLIAKFDSGDLDIALCKRWPGEERGELVWRDALVWAGSKESQALANGPVQLVLYPPPSITRFMALAALEQAGTPWRIACSSGSLSGLVAAAKAGLGIMAHARKLLPEGLIDYSAHDDSARQLPLLGDLEFVLLRPRRSLRAPVAELAAAIIAKAEHF